MGKNWLLGLTKETDERVARISSTMKRYKNSKEFRSKFRETISCPVCKTLFERRIKAKKLICCSIKCSYIYRGLCRRVEIINKICPTCNKQFSTRKLKNTKIYCSKKCSNSPISDRSRKISVKQKGISETLITKEMNSYRMRMLWASLDKETRNKWLLNGICSPKAKRNLRKANMKKKCPHLKYKRGFIRKDLCCYFRSSWEANFARILDLLNINWQYEKERILLKSCSYLPDFYLPKFNVYIEVKGYSLDNNRKLRELIQVHPNFPIKIVDSEVYSKLENQYSNLIKNWEYKNKFKYNEILNRIK